MLGFALHELALFKSRDRGPNEILHSMYVRLCDRLLFPHVSQVIQSKILNYLN